ncbi:FOS protein, partial [Atractosteus spatula]|nr:FOS protein [Atractosteus spatula]
MTAVFPSPLSSVRSGCTCRGGPSCYYGLPARRNTGSALPCLGARPSCDLSLTSPACRVCCVCWPAACRAAEAPQGRTHRSLGSGGEMFQGFPGDFDSGSRGSSSPSAESQYLSSVDSFGSPPTTAAPQRGIADSTSECAAAAALEMPGSFVPTVTAITTSQDLQWLVQPTLISSVAQSQSTSAPATSQQALTRRRLVNTLSLPPHQLTPEEEEKRRVRRERNKLAAAKCRNRRRELTDRLQSETDQLEEEKAELEAEIAELQKEKERLEFVLVAHQPACKIPYEEEPPQGQLAQQQPGPSVSILGLSMKEDPFYLPGPPAPPAYPPHPHPPSEQQQQQQQPGLMPEVAFSSSFYAQSGPVLSAPCVANPSYTSSFVFTYPEGTSTCGVSANQRNSSSDQSSDSLSSPSLLAL